MKNNETSDGLRRELGLFSSVNIALGLVVGSGIFAVPGIVAGYLDSPGTILFVWFFGGLLSLAGALTVGELAAALPHTGGSYVYLREAYGPFVGFLFAWALLLVVNGASAGCISMIFAFYCNYFVATSPLGVKMIAVGVVTGICVLNYMGVRKGSGVQNILTPLKVGVLLFLIMVGLSMGKGDWSNVFPLFARDSGLGTISTFGIALIAVLWTYDGWMDICFASGEIKNPKQTLPRTFIISVSSVTCIYVLINLLLIYVVPYGRLKASGSPASDAAQVLFGPVGGSLIAVVVMVATLSALNSSILTGARVFYAMGRDKLFFQWLGRPHPRYHTPGAAIIISGIWAVVLIFSGTFEQIMTFFVFIMWMFYGLIVGSVFVLRWKQPDLPRPYRAWGYPVTPILFLLATALLLGNTLVSSTREALIGLLILSTGIPVYLYWKLRQK